MRPKKAREGLAPPCGTAALSPLPSDRASFRVSSLPGDDQHGGAALTRRAERGFKRAHSAASGEADRGRALFCRVARLLCTEGAATAGPQVRAHAAAPAGRRKGAMLVAPRGGAVAGLRPIGGPAHGSGFFTASEIGPGLRRPDRVWSLLTPFMGWATLPFRPAAPGRNARAALTSSAFRPFGCCPAPPAGLPVRFFAAHPIPG